jgi:hypothetical protein
MVVRVYQHFFPFTSIFPFTSKFRSVHFTGLQGKLSKLSQAYISMNPASPASGLQVQDFLYHWFVPNSAWIPITASAC